MSDCIFCKIVAGKIPAAKLHEDEHTLIFRDVNPVAPTHLLAIPKHHYPSIQDIPPQKTEIMRHLFDAIVTVIKQQNFVDKGYRIVINSGEDAGQAVPHLHVHIIAGRDLTWPPG